MSLRPRFPLSSNIFCHYYRDRTLLLAPTKLFHTSKILSTATPAEHSHYDTLNLSQFATRSEIKKRFYELSKLHHPDCNRTDPHSTKKFVQISTAYAVLANPKSREKYDDDLRRHSGSVQRNPVGGRPPSGLSRRRTTPHGPPPSFFRNANLSNSRARHPYREAGANNSGINPGGGMGIGGQGSADKHDVPHFNWDRKHKQHEEYEKRQSSKRSSTATDRVDPGFIIPVIAVTSILIITVMAAANLGKSEKKTIE